MGLTKAQKRYRRDPEYRKRWTEKYFEEHPDYKKRWREENREWKAAVKKLWRTCKPKLEKKSNLESRYPGLDASEILPDEEIQRKQEEVYQRKLRELRKIYGRDPDTGMKVND